MALPTAGSVSQHREATAPLPQLGLTKDLLGSSSEWLGSKLSDPILLVSQRGRNSFSMCWQAVLRCFEKLAAGVGIREAGEGYHQVSMATVSLASPSPNPANPHQLVSSLRDCD